MCRSFRAAVTGSPTVRVTAAGERVTRPSRGAAIHDIAGTAVHRAPRLRLSLSGRVRSDAGWSVVAVDGLTIRCSDAAGDVDVNAEARGGWRIGFDRYRESLEHLPGDRAALVVGLRVL